MAELTPDELDRLEDALEEITGPDRVTDLDGLDLPPELVEHAAAYVEVLDAVAPHLASVAPSEGVLDGVLAEAREASRAAGVTAPPPVASEGRSSGRRGGWRRWWLPAVSLGGVCAGVFFLVTPEAALEDQAGTAPGSALESAATRVNEEDREGSGAAVPTPSGEPTAAPGEGDLGTPGDDGVDALRSKGYGGLGVKLKENSGDGEEFAEAEAKVAPPPKEELLEMEVSEPGPAGGGTPAKLGGNRAADSSVAPATKTPRPARKKSSKRKSATPSSDEIPTMDLDADPKAAWYEALAEAHAQVRSGACSRALDSYGELLRSEQSDQASRQQLARIQSGMGVCYERRGQLKLAESAFARARKLDAGIDPWINSLRGSGK